MLQIAIPLTSEGWDEEKQEFVEPETQILQLEHSLVSLSKWESKWCKAFFTKKEKTHEETIDYVRCMTLTENVDPDVYNHLSPENVEQILKYIDAPMTATYINERPDESGGSKDVITSELIYWWMIALQIPFECQYWHINRLLTLVKVCNAKNTPPKKMGKKGLMNHHRNVNAARRARK